MASILNCDQCGYPQEVEDDVASFLCGSCTARGAMQAQHVEEERLSMYDKAVSKKARRRLKWSQADLASHLGRIVTVAHISGFESGNALPHPLHAEWLDKQ